jgi:hypothetical protein
VLVPGPMTDSALMPVMPSAPPPAEESGSPGQAAASPTFFLTWFLAFSQGMDGRVPVG